MKRQITQASSASMAGASMAGRGAALVALSTVLAACGSAGLPAPASAASPGAPRLVPLSVAQNGAAFTLANACSGKVLDVTGAGQTNGTRVIQWGATGGANQVWTLSATDSGYYTVTAQHSAKVLDVQAAGTGNGSAVQQWTNLSGPNQQWALKDVGSGRYALLPRHAPGKALDVAGASVQDGAAVQIWDENGSCAQQWTLQAVSPNSTPASPAATAPTPDTSGPRAMRAADFLGTLGVNAHFDRMQDGGTVWAQQSAALRQKLLDSGIGFVRTSQTGYLTAGGAYVSYLKSLSGVKIDLQTDWDQNLSVLPAVATELGDRLVSLESRNEPDRNGWNDGSAAGLRQLQTDLFNLRNSAASLSAVKLIGPSVLDLWAIQQVGDMSAHTDFLNAHLYLGTANPELIYGNAGTDGNGYGSVRQARAQQGIMGGDKCLVATEAGNPTGAASPKGSAVSEVVQGRVIPRAFLELARLGVCRTYLYELVDEWNDPANPEANFGLLRHDLSEKPAFRAVRDMIALLRDGADTQSSFSPGQLNYVLTGNTDGVSQMLFQKADGRFYLALWLGKRAWDFGSGAAVVVPDQSVTLHVPTRSSATLHTLGDSGVMTHGAAQPLSGGQLTLSLSDRVTFVELN